MKKIIFTIGVLCVVATQISAQKIENIGAQINVGPTIFMGDISNSVSKSMNLMANISVKGNFFSDALQGKLTVEQGKLTGEKLPIAFENNYKSVYGSLQFKPLYYIMLTTSRLQPYVSLGYGGMWFRAREYNEETGKNVKSESATCEWMIPHGIGVEYAYNPNVAFVLDVNRVYVNSDKLDAYIGGKKDMFATVTVGISYTFGNTEKVVQTNDDDYEKETMISESECKNAMSRKDAEIKYLQDSLAKLNSIPESLRIKYCRKYLNGLLYRKCNVEVINTNLEMLDSALLKDDNITKYKYLLKNYPAWYKEFESVVKVAQNDARRYSPLTKEATAYRNDIVNRITNLSYNKRIYSEWQIYYLEDQIALIKRRLEEKVKHPEVIIDFSDLLSE
jgi:opacity protein-like surface antigen